MTKRPWYLVIAMLAATLAPVASPAPAGAVAEPVAGGVYQLVVATSGKCADVVDHSTVNGAQLQQWTCNNNSPWQHFKVTSAGNGRYTLSNINSGRCIDVPNGATTQGLRLQQWGCGDHNKTNQLWRFAPSGTGTGTGTYQIISIASGLCMSDQNASTTNGAALIQETCTHNSNKQWAFTPLTSGRTWPDVADGFASINAGGVNGTTGGAAGPTVTVTNQSDLVRYATAGTPYVIKVSGAIPITPYGTEIRVSSNKTIVGVGTSGQIVGGGFFVGAGVRNVIIRNLTIRDTRMADDDPGDDAYDYDAIQLDTADHIWIDHNKLMRMNDGLIDSRKDTTYLTVSWNILAENNKTFGIGWTDNVTARMTIHHNWIHDTNSRNPSTDNVAYAHLYNNHLQNITGYGNYSRGATRMVIENSYYDNVKDPYYKDDAAQLRQSGSIVVNSTGQRETGGSAFDPSSFYSYTLDPAADVPSILGTYAGPQSNIGT
ncbi:RICIN domain-containing protein [Nonomuraea sp. B10E15]|uniref:RICIN domain-containing protein n=1 Tax=Nonomuraea sp. B10E15 TaxID=3153560 RepID=UPI00325DCAAA